jgi:hypothetical protein
MLTSQEILAEDRFALLGIDKLIARLRRLGDDFDEKDLRHAYKQLEVNQRTSRQERPKKLLKITGPPGSYQLDLVFLPKYRRSNGGITTFLFLVEIPSRKAFAYPIKSRKSEDILDAYEKFIEQQDGNLISVTGDNEFNKTWFKAFNDVMNINVYTGVAKDDHISKQSNRLGIVDRCVRTIRKLMNKYILINNSTRWSKWLPEIIQIYNDTPHSSLNDMTPNEANADINGMKSRHKAEVLENLDMNSKTTKIALGDVVRILEAKETFAKEGPRFSKALFEVCKKDKIKWRVKPEAGGLMLRRKFATTDLLKIDPESLVALPTSRRVQDLDEKTERHRRRLQAEGILRKASDLDAAVAPRQEKTGIKITLKRAKPKPIPIKVTLKPKTTKETLIQNFKKLKDMEIDHAQTESSPS